MNTVPDPWRPHECKQNAPMILLLMLALVSHAVELFTHVYLHTQTEVNAGDENPSTRNWSPIHAHKKKKKKKKGVDIWYLQSIYHIHSNKHPSA